MYVEHYSNNSGGHWWLEDADWKNLEAAGWTGKTATDAGCPCCGIPHNFKEYDDK